MNGSFLVCVITSPDPVANEAETISRLLESGAADYVHIRRPGRPESEIRNLISRIPVELHPRLRLHDCFALLSEFDLAGVQLNSRCGERPVDATGVSFSCHSLEEAMLRAGEADYVTLSPVYDSISKSGYRSSFAPAGVKGKILAPNVIALGGVVPESFRELRDAGFAGAALLGYVWDAGVSADDAIEKIIKYNSML